MLDEPISQEMEKRLHKPLLSKPFRPRAPPRQRRARKRQELLREFDPFPPQNIRTVTDYQNEILDQYDEAKHKGKESKGQRFIRWRFIRGLEKNLTPNFMANIRENVHTAFYIRHVYSYKLRNIEDDTVIAYYTNHGSPWINVHSAAEKWLSEQEMKRLDSDNIKRALQSGSTPRYTAEQLQDQIEAQQQHESLLRVSLNSELLQTAARKHRSMNLIRLKDT